MAVNGSDFATLQKRVDDLVERVAAIETKRDVDVDHDEDRDILCELEHSIRRLEDVATPAFRAEILARVEALEREATANARAIVALTVRLAELKGESR